MLFGPARFHDKCVWQNAEAIAANPPRSFLADLLELYHRGLVGTNNMDMTLREFLLHARTEAQQHILDHIKAYEAILTFIGRLVGAVGTEQEQAEARELLAEVLQDYSGSLLDRSRRDTFLRTINPVNAFTDAVAGVYRVSGLATDVLDMIPLVDLSDTAATYHRYADTLRDLDVTALAANLVQDLVGAVINGLRDYWDRFWEEVETNGVLIALNKLGIDVSFLGAEIAIDIAISAVAAAVTGGVGAAAGVVTFAARRVGAEATRITIRASRTGSPATSRIDGPGITIRDQDIDPSINLRDENAVGGGAPLANTEARAEPRASTANTTVIRGRRGQNEGSYAVDAQTGRPASAEATLREDFGSTPRGDNATRIGREAGEGYDGGHLIAHRFMGDTVDGGIAPQVSNLNRGAWKTMENEWADWLRVYRPRSGSRVEIDVRIDVDPPGAAVPDGFDVVYRVFEVDANGVRRQVSRREKYFKNQPGETYERVYFRDDGTIK